MRIKKTQKPAHGLKTTKLVKTTGSKSSKATPAKTTPPQPPVETLPGVTIKAQVLTYKPEVHKPRIHITTPALSYYKLVPGVTTTTKAEALASAQQYREQILTTGQLPAPGIRKATPMV